MFSTCILCALEKSRKWEGDREVEMKSDGGRRWKWWCDLLYYWYKRIECTTVAVTTNEIGKNRHLIHCFAVSCPRFAFQQHPSFLRHIHCIRCCSRYNVSAVKIFNIVYLFCLSFSCAINVTRRRYFYLMCYAIVCKHKHTSCECECECEYECMRATFSAKHNIHSQWITDWIRKYCALEDISFISILVIRYVVYEQTLKMQLNGSVCGN